MLVTALYHGWQTERLFKSVVPLNELHYVMLVLCDLFELPPLKQPQLDQYLLAGSDTWLTRKTIGCWLQQCIMIDNQIGC